jgi:SAM-dependent methyltransferase
VQTSSYDRAPFIPEFYDYVVPYAARADVGFYVNAARESGGPVLELGCGTGRILIPTARAGVDIAGLDASQYMLEECRRRLGAEPPEVRERASLHRADMRDFDLGRAFALATIPFRPFQHLLAVEEQLACLGTIHRHLAPGGRLVLDIFNPSIHNLAKTADGAEADEEPPFTLPDGRSVVRRHRVFERNLLTQTVVGEIVYYVTHRDGREERLVQPLRMRYLFRFEAEHLLVRAGFTVEQVYSDFERTPYGAGRAGEIILVARRSGARSA